jgi:hypothetical protein
MSKVVGGGTSQASVITPTILEVMDNPKVWGRWFRDPESWWPWRVFLKALFGLPMDEAELEFFRGSTGLEEPPAGGVLEAWLICGRRAGKSFILAVVAVYLAVFKDWRPYLVPGEVGTIKIIAVSARQGRVIYRYCRSLIAEVPALAAMISRETDEELILTNGIAIEIQVASSRSIRGYSLVGLVGDEFGFLPTSEDSANTDADILEAARPAMATIPGAMILVGSSPYARRGELWRARREHFGKPGPVLVWQRDTRSMNPTVPQSFIDAEYRRSPESAAAEYGAQFRTDIESLFDRTIVEAAVVPGRHELAPCAGIEYHAAVDPSGGSSDAMTLAIAHMELDAAGEPRAVLDLTREVRPPFNPDEVCAEFAKVLKAYGIVRVIGDGYAGSWPAARFQAHGITYEVAA